MSGGWCEVRDAAALEAAMSLARGCYQRAILGGREAISGSTLRGKAKRYGAHYARSVRGLLARLSKAGIDWSERRGPHGKRILVIGGGK